MMEKQVNGLWYILLIELNDTTISKAEEPIVFSNTYADEVPE